MQAASASARGSRHGSGRRTRGRRRPALSPLELVYENRFLRLCRQVGDFGAFRREYFVAQYGQRAAVVAARGADILLCRQYRRLLDRVVWEIPGGKVEPSEPPRDAAVRECLEETGIRCARLAPLIRFHVGDTIENLTHVFHTRRVVATARRWDAREVEPPAWIPLERCVEMIARGQIMDSLSIIGLLAYRFLGPAARLNGASIT